MRCGVLGLWLRERILTVLRDKGGIKERVGVVCEHGRDSGEDDFDGALGTERVVPVAVGLVSHVGGHKWAGNVIFYFDYGEGSGRERRVRGVWYGRVDGDNVERVVSKTMLGFLDGQDERGMIVEELCRRVVY